MSNLLLGVGNSLKLIDFGSIYVSYNDTQYVIGKV